MRNSIFISLCFVAGFSIGHFLNITERIVPSQMISYVLYALIFFVGIGIGANVGVWKNIRKMHLKIVLVPLSVIVGTFCGTALFSIFLSDISFRHALAVGSGFGYYSLSSVIISQTDGEVLGMVALISNLMREIFTLLTAPLCVRFFGKLAPIASGGATSMDTTLPIITKVSGSDYAILSVFSGMVLTILVPFLVPLFLAG